MPPNTQNTQPESDRPLDELNTLHETPENSARIKDMQSRITQRVNYILEVQDVQYDTAEDRKYGKAVKMNNAAVKNVLKFADFKIYLNHIVDYKIDDVFILGNAAHVRDEIQTIIGEELLQYKQEEAAETNQSDPPEQNDNEDTEDASDDTNEDEGQNQESDDESNESDAEKSKDKKKKEKKKGGDSWLTKLGKSALGFSTYFNVFHPNFWMKSRQGNDKK